MDQRSRPVDTRSTSVPHALSGSPADQRSTLQSSSMHKRTEIRLAGEGGQGMILAGIILAEAAAIYDGKQVIQTQSYGPEARGGASRSEVVISQDEIDHPEVLSPDVVVALSQEAYTKFGKAVRPGGLLIVDEERVETSGDFDGLKIPIVRLAYETTGKAITANTVALGVLVGLTDLVSREAIQKAVTARAPKGTEELNREALQAGFAAAERIKGNRPEGWPFSAQPTPEKPSGRCCDVFHS